MKRILWVFGFGVFSCFLSAQQSTNPFDVRTELIETVNDTTLSNWEVVDSSKLDSIGTEQAALETVEDQIQVQQSEKTTQPEINTNIEGENPFEVSHIPLRKNQVEKHNSSRNTVSSTKNKQKESYYYLPLIIVLLSCVLLGILLMRNREILSNILRSLNNLNFGSGFQRMELGGLSMGMILMYVIFLLNFSLFIFLSLKNLIPDYNLGFYWILIALTIIYFFRHFIMNFIAWLFPIDKAIKPYNFLIQLANSIYGVILLPLNLLLAYGPDFMVRMIIFAGMLILIILFAIRYYRGFLLGMSLKAGFSFHFFIYFCTFEIVPFVLGYAYFSQVNN